MPYLFFGWNISEVGVGEVIRVRLQVYTDPTLHCRIYDSGELSWRTGLTADFETKPQTRYYWQVTAKGEQDSGSETAFFETPKEEHCWKAKWIGTPDGEDGFVSTNFTVAESVERARLYVTGLGLYEVWLDEKKSVRSI